MNNVNRRESLDNWLLSIGETNFQKGKLYDISKAMQELHKNNNCLSNIRTTNIYIVNDKDIDFHAQTVLHTNEKAFKNKNIKDLLILFIGIYFRYDSTNGLMNSEVLKNHFNDYSHLFDEEIQNYIESVIVNEEPQYFNDYIDSLYSKAESANNQEVGLRLVKATDVGKSMAPDIIIPFQERQRPLEKNNAANVNYLLIMIVTAILTLVLSLAGIYYLFIK